MVLLEHFHPAVPMKVPSLTERELEEADTGVKEAQERNESPTKARAVASTKIMCPKKEQIVG